MFLISNDSWNVKRTKEKGCGVFAKKGILAGTVIGDYLGKVVHLADYDPNNEKGMYLMYFTDQAFIYPDITKPGIHLLNHSCRPNCWIYVYHGHMLFFALRNIDAGEELTISYLLSPKDDTCNPCTHICKCKSAHCTGTMHLPQKKYTMWQQFKNEERKKTKTVKFVIGKNLCKLTGYPKRIPYSPMYDVMCRA
ncbi:MAG: SET domain-containing protein [Patescibacteria group bacterium]